MTTFDYALAYLSAGYGVLPIKTDGSKAPALKTWEEFQRRKATLDELKAWFASGLHGIGIVCGAVSMNLEVLDFDSFDAFTAFVKKVGENAVSRLPQVKTPSGGRHLYVHKKNPPSGNQKVAQRSVVIEGANKVKCLIETRGEGGQVVAPGTPANCHASGLPYVWVKPPPGVVL
jgi:putative DNA primase/helicase